MTDEQIGAALDAHLDAYAGKAWLDVPLSARKRVFAALNIDPGKSRPKDGKGGYPERVRVKERWESR